METGLETAPRRRAGIAAGAAAVAAASGLSAWLAVTAGDDATVPVLALGVVGAGALGAAVILRLTTLAGIAVGVLGGAYAILLVVDDPPLDIRAPLVAAGVVVAWELAAWSVELSAGPPLERGLAWRHVAWTALLAVGTLAAGLVVLLLADTVSVSGLLVEAAGVVAALAALLLVWRAAGGSERRTGSGPP